MACLVHESVTHCSFWIMLKFLDLSKLINLFLQVVTWICQKIYMDLLKLLLGFVTVLLCISCPLPNKTTLKFDQDFKACWSFCFEQKVLNESKHAMLWDRCAVGKVFFLKTSATPAPFENRATTSAPFENRGTYLCPIWKPRYLPQPHVRCNRDLAAAGATSAGSSENFASIFKSGSTKVSCWSLC